MSGPTLRVAGIWQIGTGIVLVRRGRGPADGTWALPGGAVAAGETLAEALVRTTAATAGVDAICGPFVGWAEVVDTEDHHVTMYFDLVVLDPPELDGRTGTMPPGPDGFEVRCTPDWEVSEVPVQSGLAEFLADQGLIELVI